MKLSQKKTCNGCRVCPMSGYASKCELGIPIKTVELGHGFTTTKPAAPCMKPKTIGEYMEVYRQRSQKLNPYTGGTES
jgi:hypothetical protein